MNYLLQQRPRRRPGTVLALVVALGGLALVGTAVTAQQDGRGQAGEQPAKKPPVEKVTIKGREFKLTLAADEPARAKGLGGVKTIPDDGGMLFVFPRSRILSFWMRGCVVDMDLIQLDVRGKIVALHSMKAEPPQGERESEAAYERRLKRYPSPGLARFAIELEYGKIKELGLKVGETIELPRGRLLRLAK